MARMLITGATSGIGLALTSLAASRGYQVIACGRNQTALNELLSQWPQNIQVKAFDHTDKQATSEALNNTKVDIVVLNAGTCEYVDTDNFDSELFKRVFNANLFGSLHVIEALLPHLQPGTQLVFVDSLARLLPFPRSQAYGASKAALHYLAKSMQVDLADRDIRVQTVSPGFVETPLTDKNDFDMPMRITAEQAAKAMLKGIEKQQSSIFFPLLFSVILRILSHLPNRLKVAVCKGMKNNNSKDVFQ